MIDGVEDTSEGDTVRQKGRNVMMKSVIMQEIQCVIKHRCNMEGQWDDMVGMQLKRS